jgi:hypothetical protein
MLTAWFFASGTTGYIASIRAPAAYSGNCGPGTLVTTRLKSRRVRVLAVRAAREWMVGGAKPVSCTRASAPTAAPLSLCAFIA